MKVAFIDRVHTVLQKGLEAEGIECFDFTDSSLDDIKKEISSFQGLVVRSRFPVDRDFLESCSSLEFIARSGAGMENIDINYCEANGIELFNAPEGNRNAVAEHALGMLLSLFNKLHSAHAEVQSGKWDREGNRGIELDGKSVGIIGYGNNGSAFARKLRGFKVDVLAYDKYKTGFGNDDVIESKLEDILDRCDVVSLHIPQNEETLGLINREFIQKMTHSFYLINLSRGKIVETRALLDGLKEGKVLGACLDVLEFEKSSFEQMFDGDLDETFRTLLKSEQVILSPHVGGWTEESYYKLSKVLLDKVLAHYKLG